MIAEKRSQGRLLTAVTVRAIVEDPAGSAATDREGTTFTCQTRDMSLAGMCLLSRAVIPRGTRLHLDVQVDAIDKVFSHRAQVIWCREEDGAWLVGLHILESMCDEVAWKNTVIDILIG